MEGVTAYDAAQYDWYHGDGYAVENPYHARLCGYGLYELLACAQSHTCQEDADAYLANHQVGGNRIIGHKVVLRTKVSYQDSHDERTSCQSESQTL